MTSRARPAIPEGIAKSGVVAIARRLDPTRALAIAHALGVGGVGAFELVVNRSRQIVAAVAAARAELAG